MRILFAGLTSPYPPTNGHRLRTWAMIRALVDDGHRVSVVALNDSPEPPGDLRPLEALCEDVEVVPAPPRATGSALVGRLRTLTSGRPHGVWKFEAPRYTRALSRRLEARRFDAVICDGAYNMQNMPSRLGVPLLLNKDDVAHVIMQRYAAVERHPIRRGYARVEAWKVARWEALTAARARVVLACSEVDRRELLKLQPSARVVVVPNVVDTEHYAPIEGTEPDVVLFQGGMDWQPNRDAVVHFVADILPELRRVAPAARFRVAGRCTHGDRGRFARVPGVELTGRVPDMRAEIAKAAVCVVPLRIGSGTRLKILEAAAMGKAVVSTPLGTEGLDFIEGEEIALAATPQAFADAVTALLADADRRRAMGAAARLRVQKAYGLAAHQTALHAALEECKA